MTSVTKMTMQPMVETTAKVSNTGPPGRGDEIVSRTSISGGQVHLRQQRPEARQRTYTVIYRVDGGQIEARVALADGAFKPIEGGVQMAKAHFDFGDGKCRVITLLSPGKEVLLQPDRLVGLTADA